MAYRFQLNTTGNLCAHLRPTGAGPWAKECMTFPADARITDEFAFVYEADVLATRGRLSIRTTVYLGQAHDPESSDIGSYHHCVFWSPLWIESSAVDA